MKTFVIGRTGLISNALYEEEKDNLDYFFTSSSLIPQKERIIPFNLQEIDSFPYHLIEKNDLIILTAAISSPDECHQHYARSLRINVTGPVSFIEKITKLGGRVIFFSSDTVYGKAQEDNQRVFHEDDACVPLGDYAKMKREVEVAVSQNPLVKILRLSLVIHHSDKSTRYLESCLKKNLVAEIFHPYYRNAIILSDILSLLKVLSQPWTKSIPSIINVGGDDLLSRVDLAKSFQKKNSSFRFSIVRPPESFYFNRPEIISISNLRMKKLLQRDPAAVTANRKIDNIFCEGINL